MEDEYKQFIHCWQLRMATTVSFWHRQLSSSPQTCEELEVPRKISICTYLDRRECGDTRRLTLVQRRKKTKLLSFSFSVLQLTSLFNCPAGMSMIWRAVIFPRLPPILTLRPSPVRIHQCSPPFPNNVLPPCPANSVNSANTKRICISPEGSTRKTRK